MNPLCSNSYSLSKINISSFQNIITIQVYPPQISRVALLTIRSPELHINLVSGPNIVEDLLNNAIFISLRKYSFAFALETINPVMEGVRTSVVCR